MIHDIYTGERVHNRTRASCSAGAGLVAFNITVSDVDVCILLPPVRRKAESGYVWQPECMHDAIWGTKQSRALSSGIDVSFPVWRDVKSHCAGCHPSRKLWPCYRYCGSSLGAFAAEIKDKYAGP